jgi:hypothetical protein
MAILLVTYDLRQPGRNYQAVYDYIKQFTWCKGMESVWLIDTNVGPKSVRDGLSALTDGNDRIFVVQITRDWASWNYPCGDWLNDSARNW